MTGLVILSLPSPSLRPCCSSPSSFSIRIPSKPAFASASASSSSSPSSPDSLPLPSAAADLSFRGCKACGRDRDELEKGCNGEGRIQGGIGTVPGFGWWPIKAYRPCPAFVACGGRYRRTGQTMDEVAFGRPGPDQTPTVDQPLSSKEKQSPMRFKR